MNWRAIAWTALLAAAGGVGCMGTSPERAEQNSWGKEEGEKNELHRPGEACLSCHGTDYHPGDKVFVVAGTVYLRAADTSGLSEAEVDFEDAAGDFFTVRANSAGNFMVQVNKDVSAPTLGGGGRLLVPREPAFPLRNIVVRYPPDQLRREMASHVWRDGSCAGCHIGAQETPKTVEKVFVIEKANF